jgi:nicotinamidase/pyrazinamidase
MTTSAQLSSSIGVSLVLVDVQNDFLPGGSLAVPSSSKILPPILSLLAKKKCWASVVATQDYHPTDHISFADNHKGAEAFKAIQVDHPLLGCNGEGEKIEQMMWPRHCVQGTPGCQIHKDIRTRLAELRKDGEDVVVIRKVRKADKNADRHFVRVC